jgi:signal peptidase II
MARTKNRFLVSNNVTSPWIWLGLAAIVIVLDQFTKRLILGFTKYGESIEVTSFFNIVHAYNKGAAFSFLANAGGWQRWFFTALGVAVSAFIIYTLFRSSGEKLFCFALSLIMAGAVGNVIDRVLYGHVVDFAQVHHDILSPLFPQGYFPAFNVADSAITIGAICLILDEFLRVRRSKR